MKRFLLALNLFLISITGYSITLTVGGAGADYSTLKSAFDAINNGLITGNIILKITGNTIETATAKIDSSGSGGVSNYYDILIFPTVPCSISGNLNASLITINATRNITFDGRINQSGAPESLQIVNTGNGANAATISIINSSKKISLQYLKLNGATSSTTNGIISILGSPNGGTGNDSLTVQYCDISGISPTNGPTNCIYSKGESISIVNDHIEIAHNKIYDFYSSTASTKVCGILVKNYNTLWNIHHNSFYQTVDRTAGSFYCLAANADGSSGLVKNITISDNKFGGKNEQATGTFQHSNSTGEFLALELITDNNQINNVNNNVIRGITSPSAHLLYFQGKFRVFSNTFGGVLNTERLTLNSGNILFHYSATNSSFYNNTVSAIYASSYVVGGFNNVTNNTFTEIVRFGSTSGIGPVVSLLDSAMYNSFDNLINKSAITNCTVAAYNSLNDITLSSSASCISSDLAHHNTVKKIKNTGTLTNLIKIFSGKNIHYNYIELIKTADYEPRGSITGISHLSLGAFNASNNVIQIEFDSAFVDMNRALGIDMQGSTSLLDGNIFHNTIIIGGKLSASSKSYCIGFNDNYPNVNIKNNLLVNHNSGTSLSYCLSVGANYNLDYNDYVINGANAKTGFFNNTGYLTLGDWQGGTFQDFNSLAIDPSFVNINSGNLFGYAPQIDLAGTQIVSVTDDILGNVRPNPPTMGALEKGICPPTYVTLDTTVCGSFELEGTVYTNSGSFSQTVTDSVGCSTFYTIELTVNQVSSTTMNVTACASYTWIDGNTYTSNNNTATYSYAGGSVNGCDSIVNLNLEIINIDNLISQVGDTVMANASLDNYQWVYCDSNYLAIPGANDYFYLPAMNGNYAVIIGQGSCVDTSSCLAFTVVGKEEISAKNEVVIWPNPAKDLVFVSLNHHSSTIQIQLFAYNGDLIQTQNFYNSSTVSFKIEASPGVYFMSVKDDQGVIYKKLIKSN